MTERPAFEPVPFDASIHPQGPLVIDYDRSNNNFDDKDKDGHGGLRKTNDSDNSDHRPEEADAFVPICTCPAGFSLRYFEKAADQLIAHPEYNSTLILRSETLSDTDARRAPPSSLPSSPSPSSSSKILRTERDQPKNESESEIPEQGRSRVSSGGLLPLPKGVPHLRGLRPVRIIRRRLLPRRPGRDASIEQYCTFYVPVPKHDEDAGDNDDDEHEHVHEQLEGEEHDVVGAWNATVVVLTPILNAQVQSDDADDDGGTSGPTVTKMPYYHPDVVHLAFRYIAGDVSGNAGASGTGDLDSSQSKKEDDENVDDGDEDSSQSQRTNAHLRVEVILPPSLPSSLTSNSHPSSLLPTAPTSRLYRTSLSLLSTLHRYGWGARTAYRKRVAHDVLIPRDEYQDLYLTLRARHAGRFVGEGGVWAEKTDPRKHVFEDIGIATYLMLLWKQGQYAIWSGEPEGEDTVVEDTEDKTFDSNSTNGTDSSNRMPWHSWPRPPGGFLDLGCGNGLLVDILTAEGYVGAGIDVRARASWSIYPERTRERLHVASLDPLKLFPGVDEDSNEVNVNGGPEADENKPPNHPSSLTTSINNNPNSNSTTFQTNNSDPDGSDGNTALIHKLLRKGTFLIANHADELSPWAPILATLSRASGYLSVPCCAWSLDARFVRSQLLTTTEVAEMDPSRNKGIDAATYTALAEPRVTAVPFALGPPPSARSFAAFVDALRLGADVQLGSLDVPNTANAGKKGNVGAGGSGYAAYRAWLACLGAYCGWGAPVHAPGRSGSSVYTGDASGATNISACVRSSSEPENSSSQSARGAWTSHALLDTPESDVLRIPSTRNWALVGRAHAAGTDIELERVYRERVSALLHVVRARGVFRTRRPEGKAGAAADH